MRRIDFPQLDQDAPPVPDGLRPRDGVEFGCGNPTCTDCYEARCDALLSIFTHQVCTLPAGHEGGHKAGRRVPA